MTDKELRGLVLRRFYERRREGLIQLNSGELPEVSDKEIFRICVQLAEKHLVEWYGLNGEDGTPSGGQGQISSYGADVMEGETPSPMAINLDQSSHITITGSSNVQVGDGNSQQIHLAIEQVVLAINSSGANDDQKKEAKTLLSKFLEHPLVCSIAGSLTSLVK